MVSPPSARHGCTVSAYWRFQVGHRSCGARNSSPLIAPVSSSFPSSVLWFFGPSLHRHYSGFSATTASDDFFRALTRKISPGKVQNLSPRAARLYLMRLDDCWALLFPASLPPASGLTANFCSYGREFATRCFQLRLVARPCVSLRLPSSAPVGSFHPTRFCPCWAHWRTHSCVPRRHSWRRYRLRRGEIFPFAITLATYMRTRRRLPHIYPPNRWLFVTWHLHGSLPQGLYPRPDNASAGQAFVWVDRQLDAGRCGPLFLRRPEIAQIVHDSIQRGVQLGHYQLGAFVIMANHVHVLLLPRIEPCDLLKSLKGYTARQANRLLGRTGEPFWERESYDHWVRDEKEWSRIAAYIENNPVKAGLVAGAEDYPWSSASSVAKSGDAARTGACATTVASVS